MQASIFGEVGVWTSMSKVTDEATLLPCSAGELLAGSFTVPFSALIPFDEKTSLQKLHTLVCDDLTKEAVLQHMGFLDPFVIPEFESDTLKKPESFDQDHIMMYATLVQWTFEELSVFVY